MKYICRECGRDVDSEDKGQRINYTGKDLEHTRSVRVRLGVILTVGCGPLVRILNEL